MATQAKLVSVALNTVTGQQVITGAGFQADFIFAYLTPLTAAGGGAHAQFAFAGIKNITTGQMIAYASEDSSANMDSGAAQGINNAPFMRITDQESVTVFRILLESIDSDGCTIDITTAPAAAYILNLLFIRSDTASPIQSAAGIFNANTALGDQDITGLGFDSPDLVILCQAMIYTSGTGVNSGNVPSTSFIGWAAGGNQACAAACDPHNITTTNTKSGLFTDRIAHLETQTTLTFAASYVSGITGGFRINISTTAGAAYRIGYIALKGLSAKVVNFVSSTGTGQTGVTGAGFKPSAIMAQTNGKTSASYTDHAKRGFGAASASTQRAAIAVANTDALLDTDTSRHLATDAFLTSITAGHASPTLDDKFDLVSFDNDGITYDHEVASGNAIQCSILALGPAQSSNQTLLPTGIASAAAFGTPTIQSGSFAQTLLVTGIPSAAVFGTPVIGGASLIQPSSVRGPGAAMDVDLIGTFDDVAFDPQFTQYKVELISGPDPRSAFVPFGTGIHTFIGVLHGTYTARWMLSNSDGSVTSNVQSFQVVVTNVGTPTMVIGGGGGGFVLQPSSIPSAESFGNPTINLQFNPSSIASAEAFGSPTVVTGGQGIVITQGIPSAEAFGNPVIMQDQNLGVVSILSSEAFGNPIVEFEGAQVLNVESIVSSEEFGTVTILIPVAPPQWPPIEDPHTVWTRIPPGREG